MDTQEFKEKAKTVGLFLLDIVGKAMEIAGEEKARQVIREDNTVVVLTAKELDQLYWMDPDKLRTLFGNRKVQIASDPETLNKAYWLSKAQMEALLGTDRKNCKSDNEKEGV